MTLHAADLMPDLRFLNSTVRLRVPATSANLGPGFDTFGLALGLCDLVEVVVVDAGLEIAVEGEGARSVPRDGSHLLVQAMHRAFEAMGARPAGLRVRCTNAIPHGRGLGSSAAAVVAGILAARAVTVDGSTLLPDAAVLALASAMEGHPDNVAACLRGGFTIAWTDTSESPHALRLDVHPDVVPVVLVPEQALATQKARRLLPSSVSHRDAAANSARAALFVAALTRAPELLLDATEDRLHQEFRRSAMPDSLRLVDELRGQGVAAVVSGAGPAVLALARHAQVCVVRAAGEDGWRVLALPVDSQGCVVEPTESADTRSDVGSLGAPPVLR